jgi:hypothetical protein
LVLQWTHGRQRSEMMVEGRCTHIDLCSKIIDTQRPGEVPLQPIDCPRYLLTLTSRRIENFVCGFFQKRGLEESLELK